MADSGVVCSLNKASRELRSKFLERVCTDMYSTMKSSQTKKLPWGYVTKIVNEAKAREPWITKNKIYFAFKKFCLKRNLEETDDSSKSVATINKPCTGGRPKGSTIINQYHHKETLAAAKNEIFALYRKEKRNRAKMVREYHKGG